MLKNILLFPLKLLCKLAIMSFVFLLAGCVAIIICVLLLIVAAIEFPMTKKEKDDYYGAL